ncbi:MAG TPA: protein kinase [Pyrinomonadaceae bacterium]|nr:protein kinase [Pyrinomonadaceae bacterium]
MSILADAMECDTGQRGSFVAGTCAGDESLRRDVERLLRYSKPARDFMEESLFEAAAHWYAGNDEPLIGGRIGPYRVTDELGRGGMGAVYRAVRNDDEYQRDVAIKLVKRGMDTDVILRRFRNERQILANLDHQNIARLFDGGTTEDGRPYLVMEYVEGRPIQYYADEHQLSVEARLKLFLSVCEAVDYAHSHNVIHRDLKPGNIFVTNEGIPKLLDFGIAKVLYSDPAAITAETTLTALRGMTPEYASPEQLRGESLTVASDVYSLGVLLYELLTGHRPYPGRHASPYELAQMVCEIDPPKPSTTVTRTEKLAKNNGEKAQLLSPEVISEARDSSPEQLRRALSGDLDRIILMALSKEPERRYKSVVEFAEDIRRHLAGFPILARKDSRVYRAGKFLKRNRGYVLITALVAVICLALGISLALVTTKSGAPRSIAVMPFVNVSQDQSMDYLSDGVTDELINRLSRFPSLRVPARGSVFRYKGTLADARTVGHDLGVDRVLTGRIAREGDRLVIEVSFMEAKDNSVIWQQQYRGDSSHLLLLQKDVSSDVIARLGLTAQADSEKRQPKDDGAYLLYLRGNYFWNRRNAEGFVKAIDYYQSAIERDPNYALAYDGLAKSYGLQGAYFVPNSGDPFPRAKAAALKALELDPDLAEAHTTLALVNWLYDWDWEAADREFRRAIDLNPSYVTAHHWYGLYLGEMGRAEESIAEEKRALELDPVSLPVIADLGRVYYWARRYDEALQQYTKALEMEPTFGTIYAELRYVYEQKKMYREWFTVVDPNTEVNDENRKAYATYDWMEYVRISTKYGGPHDRAENYARLGDTKNALEQLELARKEHDHRLSQLRVHPVWDQLRSEPRFQELLRRMKL